MPWLVCATTLNKRCGEQFPRVARQQCSATKDKIKSEFRVILHTSDSYEDHLQTFEDPAEDFNLRSGMTRKGFQFSLEIFEPLKAKTHLRVKI